MEGQKWLHEIFGRGKMGFMISMRDGNGLHEINGEGKMGFMRSKDGVKWAPPDQRGGEVGSMRSVGRIISGAAAALQSADAPRSS